MMPTKFKTFLALVAFLASLAHGSAGNLVDLKDWEAKVNKRVLKNGLTVLVVERHDVPTVSFVTYAKVGSVDEVAGITGMAHMFEHMAFKGTSTIGTKNFGLEKKAMDQLETLYLSLRAEQQRGSRADPKTLDLLKAEFLRVREEASQLGTIEYEQLIEQAGAQHFNAFTSADQTVYHYSLTSNKLELWMFLESERYRDPVLRDFYKERDVVMEERRRSYEDKPNGKLYLQLINLAYEAHPYGVGTIGHMSDLQTISRTQAEEFYRTHYAPANLVVAIVGDVDAAATLDMAEAYFGRLTARPTAPPVATREPRQQGEKRLTLELPAQPTITVAYHLDGGSDHPDAPVYSVLSTLLTGGRTSILERLLVQEQQVAVGVNSWTGPGNKYPGLFMIGVHPAPGRTLADVETALYAALEELKTKPVDPAALEKAKRQDMVGTLQALNDNHSIAMVMASSEAMRGDWREQFRDLDRVQAVTAADLQRVASRLFVKTNRSVGMIQSVKRPDSQPGQQGQQGDKTK